MKRYDPMIDSHGYIHMDTVWFLLALDGGMGGGLHNAWIVTGLKK
jgi:hypothetical protein